MTEKQDKLWNGADEVTAHCQAEIRPNVVHDHANMQHVYTNRARVIRGHNEIKLLFGKTHSHQDTDKEMEAQFSEQIILSNIAAEQLYILLNNAIQDYELKSGKPNIKNSPGDD